jgi:hypothetical protein
VRLARRGSFCAPRAALNAPLPPPPADVSYTPSGHEADRRLHDWGVSTGRYCPKAGAFCDPCCEGRVSTFVEYGSGVTAFFKNLKALAWTFLFMSLLSVPGLLLNVNAGAAGTISLDSLTLSATTVGNLVAQNATAPALVVPGWSFVINRLRPGSGGAVDRATAALAYSLFDVAACVWLRALRGPLHPRLGPLTTPKPPTQPRAHAP